MKIVIVYENVPESTDLYIEEVTPEEWKWIRLTHRRFINTEMPKKAEKACQELYKWLAKKKKIESKPSKPIPTVENDVDFNVDYIVLTGFIM